MTATMPPGASQAPGGAAEADSSAPEQGSSPPVSERPEVMIGAAFGAGLLLSLLLLRRRGR